MRIEAYFQHTQQMISECPHEGSETHVIASHAPELADVLQEIELLVKLS